MKPRILLGVLVALAGGLSACGHSAHELQGTPWIWSSHWDPGPEGQARARAGSQGAVDLANDRAAADAALIILTRTELAASTSDKTSASQPAAVDEKTSKKTRKKRSKRRGKKRRRR